MANWRKTRTPAIYVAHSKSCPAYADAAARCRCKPSWRGRRWDPVAGKPIWQKATKNRGEVLTLARAPIEQGRRRIWPSSPTRGPTFEDARRAMARRRRARPHRPAPRPRQGVLRHDDRGHAPLLALPAAARVRAAGRVEEITEIDWQRWIDQLARDGLSRSTIAKHVSVASGIYAWASAPSRRLVPRNPLRLVELPPNDEKPRLRVALAPEAAALLAALEPEDRLPYAIAFYAGLRRAEIYRLEWDDVLDGDAIATRLLVRRSKSEAGTAAAPADRRQPPRRPRRRLGAPGPPARRARSSTAR